MIAKSDPGHTNSKLECSLASGNYWTVVQGRYLDNPDLIRCRHRIRVV